MTTATENLLKYEYKLIAARQATNSILMVLEDFIATANRRGAYDALLKALYEGGMTLMPSAARTRSLPGAGSN
jgi:hypothetical protein